MSTAFILFDDEKRQWPMEGLLPRHWQSEETTGTVRAGVVLATRHHAMKAYRGRKCKPPHISMSLVNWFVLCRWNFINLLFF
jgi:hypothetical protein